MFTQLRSNLKFLGAILFALVFLVGGVMVNAKTTFAAPIYVDATNGSNSYDGTAISPTDPVTTVGPKQTIQAAIDIAASGDIINIAEGTYPEKLLIDGKTNLTIQGAGQGKNGGPLTLIEPAYNDTGTAGITIKNSNGLTIQDLKIHTAGREMEGIWVLGFAFGADAITGLTIQNTTIIVDGGTPGQSAAGIVGDAALNAAHSGWLITENTITSNAGVAISIQDVTASTISSNILTVQTAGTNVLWTSERHNLTGLSFSDNTVSGSGGVQVLIVTDYNQGTSNVNVENPVVETTISGVTFHHNTFSNWDTRAIKVGDQANVATGTVTNISITDNTFNDNHSWSAIFNIATSIIGGLDAPSATGSGNIFNVSGTAKIQTAIGAAFSGDTINVAEGTYIEQLTINKNLTLIGAGEDKTTIQSLNTLTSTFEATINNTVSPMKPIITINGADANISALKVDGLGKGDSVNNTFFVGIGFYNAGGSLDHVTVTGVKETLASPDYQGDAVRATNANGDIRTLSITNSTISDFQKNGITLSGSGLTVTVSDNHVTGTGANDMVAQNGIVLGTGVTGSITNNTVKDLMCNYSTCGSDWYTEVQAIAIAIVGAGSKTVSGNTVSNSDIGIYSELASGVATITNNILTGNRYFGMLFEKGDVAVSGGSVTSGEIGIFNSSDRNTGTTTVHNVNISGNSIAGLKNDAASLSVNATSNWWGNASGPGVVGPGTGDKVSLNVTFDPWYTDAGMTTLSNAPKVNHGSSGGYATPAVPAKVETPDGCAAGNKFSTTTGRNCNAATPAVPAGQVLGAEKFNFTLFVKNGSNGSEIIELQNFLNTLGYTLVADGKFGPKTKGAVIKFQLANSLVGDGVIGAKTRAALNK